MASSSSHRRLSSLLLGGPRSSTLQQQSKLHQAVNWSRCSFWLDTSSSSLFLRPQGQARGSSPSSFSKTLASWICTTTLGEEGKKGETSEELAKKEGTSGVSLKEKPRVVILGQPNVGKSTLFNRLTSKTGSKGNRKTAITLNTPEGHVTRDVISGKASLGDLKSIIWSGAGLPLFGRERAWGSCQIISSLNLLVLVVVKLLAAATSWYWWLSNY